MSALVNIFVRVYLALLAIALFLGLLFGPIKRATPFTFRIHYILPTYVLGYWLTEGLEEK